MTMNTTRIENDDASTAHAILNSCRICGTTVVDLSSMGLPSYCRRHHYVMARVLELVGNRDRISTDTQQYFKQAEAEASRIFGDIDRY